MTDHNDGWREDEATIQDLKAQLAAMTEAKERAEAEVKRLRQCGEARDEWVADTHPVDTCGYCGWNGKGEHGEWDPVCPRVKHPLDGKATNPADAG